MTALVWFTRDLRVHDHPALRAALDAHERVIPVFVLDDVAAGRAAPLRAADAVHARVPWNELDAALTERGGGLVIRQGPRAGGARAAGR